MIITAKSLTELLLAVKIDKHESEDKSVLIFAANGDVDSVCAAAQLEVRSAARRPSSKQTLRGPAAAAGPAWCRPAPRARTHTRVSPGAHGAIDHQTRKRRPSWPSQT